VQVLVQELVITKHTTYPKISYRGIIDFEIQQSRFFTFLFFMQKYHENV
jgi:hypothetical protein